MPAPLKTDAEKAVSIQIAATALAAQLKRDNGSYGYHTNHRLLELCNAVISLIEDGDCMACRECLMFELGCDEDGDPQSDLVPFTKCNAALTGFPVVKA